MDIVGRREDQDAALDLICEKVLYCRREPEGSGGTIGVTWRGVRFFF